MLKIDAANIIITVINLLVLFVAMKLVFFKPISKIINQRQEEADKQLSEADCRKKEAEALKKQYSDSLEEIEETRKQAMTDTRKSADEEYQRIVGMAQEEAAHIKQVAQTEAEKEKAKIINSARKDIADMVVDAAAKVVGSQNGVEVDGSLYNEFLGKAGD